jgi:hypothetical protein
MKAVREEPDVDGMVEEGVERIGPLAHPLRMDVEAGSGMVQNCGAFSASHPSPIRPIPSMNQASFPRMHIPYY